MIPAETGQPTMSSPGAELAQPGGRSLVPLLSGVATVSVAVALVPGFMGFHPLGLALATVGALAAVAAAVVGRRDAGAFAHAQPRLGRLLAAALIAFLVSHLFIAPGIYLRPAHPVAFRILAGVATLLASTFLLPAPRWLARWRFPALVGLWVAMAVVVVLASPFPFIDVWWIQQYGASLVWSGENPYTFLYPNIYGTGALFGPGVLERGMVASYPYPPLTFLLGAPAVIVLEDVRFLMIGLAATAALVGWRWCRSDAAELAILAFLLQPRGFFVVEQSWTEPLVLATFAATVLAVLRWRARAPAGWIVAGAAGALLLASKQYAPLLALPFLPVLPTGRRLTSVGVALGLAALTFVPFLLWNAGELHRDLVLMQLNQPFRMDALSWLVPVARAVGRPVTAAWAFLGAGLVLLLAFRRDATPAHAARVAAAAFLVFVLFNKQAFCNYYWLVVGLLALSTSLGLRANRAN